MFYNQREERHEIEHSEDEGRESLNCEKENTNFHSQTKNNSIYFFTLPAAAAMTANAL